MTFLSATSGSKKPHEFEICDENIHERMSSCESLKDVRKVPESSERDNDLCSSRVLMTMYNKIFSRQSH